MERLGIVYEKDIFLLLLLLLLLLLKSISSTFFSNSRSGDFSIDAQSTFAASKRLCWGYPRQGISDRTKRRDLTFRLTRVDVLCYYFYRLPNLVRFVMLALSSSSYHRCRWRGDDAFDVILSVWCFDFLDVDVMTFIRQKCLLWGMARNCFGVMMESMRINLASRLRKSRASLHDARDSRKITS